MLVNSVDTLIYAQTLTIAINTDTTNAISTFWQPPEGGGTGKNEGLTLFQIQTPAAMTGTTFSLLGCQTETGTYVEIRDPATGVAYTWTIGTGAGRFPTNPVITGGAKFIKVKSNGTESTARTLIAYLRRAQ